MASLLLCRPLFFTKKSQENVFFLLECKAEGAESGRRLCDAASDNQYANWSHFLLPLSYWRVAKYLPRLLSAYAKKILRRWKSATARRGFLECPCAIG